MEMVKKKSKLQGSSKFARKLVSTHKSEVNWLNREKSSWKLQRNKCRNGKAEKTQGQWQQVDGLPDMFALIGSVKIAIHT